jgi:hypothetical protein
METYDVQIRATVTKTIRVTAKTEDDAWDLAHKIFSVGPTDDAEHYEQDTVFIEEVERAEQ